MTVGELIYELEDIEDEELEVYLEVKHARTDFFESPAGGVDILTDPLGTRVVIHDYHVKEK